jgi:hypothetical protein
MKDVYFQIEKNKLVATSERTEKTVAAVRLSFDANPQRLSFEDVIDAELDEINQDAVTEEYANRVLKSWADNWYRESIRPSMHSRSIVRVELI